MVNKIKGEFDFETTFPPLGHPEHHFNKYPNHPWLKTKEEIIEWLTYNDDDPYMVYDVYDDLTVKITTSEDFGYGDLANFWVAKDVEFVPFKTRVCADWKVVTNSSLKSLIGVPYMCNEIDFEDTEIEKIEDFPYYVDKVYAGSKLKSFIGMKEGTGARIFFKPNNIDSWEGFAAEKAAISIMKSNDLDMDKDKVIQLIMTAPDNIMEINVVGNKNKEEILKEIQIEVDTLKHLNTKVDMEWLRNEQIKERFGNINNEINSTLLRDEDVGARKRKI